MAIGGETTAVGGRRAGHRLKTTDMRESFFCLEMQRYKGGIVLIGAVAGASSKH